MDNPDLVDQELAERSLVEFLSQFWMYIDNGAFQNNWHIEAKAEHLQAVLDGQIRKLIINEPPRQSKSTVVSVAWPAHSWIKHPSIQWLFSSYAATLAIRDSVKCRRIIESPLYQKRWGDKFHIVSDQNTKSRFDNNRNGYRLATSVDGSNTGEGGNILVIDDPHNIKEIESETKRQSTLDWWDQAMSSRLNNPKEDKIVIVAQRSHAKDLCGHVRTDGDWVELILPMEFEPKKRCMIEVTGWMDPRTEKGELLNPGRVGEKENRDLKRRLGSYGYAGQCQQRPSPKGGGLVKLKWFNRYTEQPRLDEFGSITISCDTANKDKDSSAPTAVEVWWEDQFHKHYLIEVWRDKVQYPELERKIITICSKYRQWLREVLIEDKSSGIVLIQNLNSKYDFPIIPVEPRGDKEVRMDTEAPAIEAGHYYLPSPDLGHDWLFDFETEVENYPKGTMDQIDAMSQYCKRKRLAGWGEEWDEDMGCGDSVSGGVSISDVDII